MANKQLEFRRYETTEALTAAKTSFAVGDVVFDKQAKVIYIVTAKSDTTATLEPYYGNNAIANVTCSNATITITLSDGTTRNFTVDNVSNAGSATKATNDSNNKTITDEYLHRASNSASTLSQFSGAPDYLLGIESFANGGAVKWQNASSISVGSATNATNATNATYLGNATSGYTYSTLASALAGKSDTSHNHDSVYFKKSGGTISGATTINGGLTATGETDVESLTADSLLVNGAARFVNEIQGTSAYASKLGTSSANYTYSSLNSALAGKANNNVTITGTGALSGGGAISSNQTITHNKVTQTNQSLTANGRTYVTGITLDDYGHISSISTGTESDQTSISGNAATATKLQTARKINGTDFDGSAAITTEKWGTARNITIKDSTSAHSGTAVSVDGSSAVSLILPSTIAADITGNAASASSVAWTAVSGKPSLVTIDGDQVITGKKNFRTYVASNGTANTKNPLCISRGWSDTTELVQIWVDDSIVNFEHIQDETVADYVFKGTWTDTESNFGANAGSAYIRFALRNGESNIYVNSDKVWHAGNDGAGSGLDADKLDGYDASSFSLNGHNHDSSYLKLTGGTVTGATTFNGATSINNTLTADSISAGNLTVNGTAVFNNGLSGTLTGNLVGNATTSTSCTGNAATATTASKTQAALTFGSKTFDGSVAKTITVADLGLSSALLFLGTTTSEISDGSTTNPIVVGGSNVTATAGSVVLKGNLEYIWTGSAWEQLGDENSFALKSIQISAGGGLTGGGTLEATRTISHADTSSQASMTTGGRTYINSITLDDYGHVTALGTATETDQTDISGNAATATSATNDSDGNKISTYYLPKSGGSMTGTLNLSNIYSSVPQIILNNSGSGLQGITFGPNCIIFKHMTDINTFSDDALDLYAGVYKVWNAGNLTKLSQLTDDLGTSPAHSHSQYALKNGDTITGAYVFNSGVTFKDSVTIDSLIAEDLIVNAAARFISGITSNGDITAPKFIGDLQGNASTATSAGNAGTVGGESASAFAHRQDANNLVHSGNEITMVPDSFRGNLWFNYRTASWNANGAISQYYMGNGATGCALVRAEGFIHNSYQSSAYALTSDGGVAHIGSMSVNYANSAGSAGSATTAGTATNATNDSDGNQIKTTYAKLSGATFNGAVAINNTLTSDSISAGNLTVNGTAVFNNGLSGTLTGSLIGNASTATSATSAGTATNLSGGSVSATTGSFSGTITSTYYGPAFHANVSNNWAYMRLTSYSSSSSNYWDLATTVNNSHALEFRYNGGDSTRTRIFSNGIILQQGANSWLYPAYLQLGRPNTTCYTDKACIGVTNGNLHIDAYSGYGIYLGYYKSGSGGDSTAVVLTSTGNLGVGTASPSYKLHVNGTSYISSSLTVVGDVAANSNLNVTLQAKAQKFNVDNGCTIEYSSTDKCLKFVFA